MTIIAAVYEDVVLMGRADLDQFMITIVVYDRVGECKEPSERSVTPDAAEIIRDIYYYERPFG